MKLTYPLSDLAPYINWLYFFFAWQVKDQAEKDRLRKEAEALLTELEDRYHAYGLFELFDAYSDGDDIVILRGNGQEPVVSRIPCLRQQQGNPPYLCLSDFLAPYSNHKVQSSKFKVQSSKFKAQSSKFKVQSSKLALFATSVDIGLETDFDADPYQAAAEKMHEQVRKEYWGYAKDEHLTIPEMLVEKFQGIRPAVGYPSLPDTSLNFLIDEIIGMHQIGIHLTESGAMKPHASVSGLMLAHPQARYFSIGKIGEDQLLDYAHRRGLPLELCRKFLAANL